MLTQGTRHSSQPPLPGLFPEQLVLPGRRQDPIRVHEDIMRDRWLQIRQLVVHEVGEKQASELQRTLVDTLYRRVELFEQEAAIYWGNAYAKHRGCNGYCLMGCAEALTCPLAVIMREEGRAINGGGR